MRRRCTSPIRRKAGCASFQDDPDRVSLTAMRWTAGLVAQAAAYSGIDIGDILASFKTPINMKFCADLGLVQNPDTMAAVERNIPKTLAISKTTDIILGKTLFKFHLFIQNCIWGTRQKLMRSKPVIS